VVGRWIGVDLDNEYYCYKMVLLDNYRWIDGCRCICFGFLGYGRWWDYEGMGVLVLL